MKKILVIITSLLLLPITLLYATEPVKGKVIKKDKERRLIAIDVGKKNGIKIGSAFVIYDNQDMDLGCILAEQVFDDMFWSDLVPIDIYEDIEIGSAVEELGAGCRIEGAILAYVPKGFFGMGDNKKDDELPMHSRYLNPYYIDKYEVTNKDYKKFVDATGRQAPFLDSKEAAPYNWVDNNFPSGQEEKPVVLVTLEDAKEYCKFAGKRLPTEEEWEKAARGTGNRVYPWGNVWDSKKLNCKDNGGSAVEIIGNFPDDLSPYDVTDMGGNVSEWTASPYLPYENNHKDVYYSKDLYVIRGGSWQTGKKEARTSARHPTKPDTKSVSIGFRCVKEIN